MLIIKSSILIILISIANTLIAQEVQLQGYIIDSSENTFIEGSVVIVLKAKDSTLVSFQRTDKRGEFQIKKIIPGKYIMLVTHPEYVDHVKVFEVDSDKAVVPINSIALVSKAKMLKEVIVRSGSMIRVRGDTTEYKADSFKLQSDASVEDLLKQLPGIQVNNKGEISVRGQRVSKVLVDGDEFFGDDPTLVTRNLKAGMIDKVQVFDKKSDQALFTGIDDGQKQKTINVKLKEDQKNNYFGKIEAGYGSTSFYENQASINYFKGKKKVAAYLTHSNTAKIGLNWNSTQFYDSGDMNLQSSGLSNWNGRYNGVGIPQLLSGGVHFDNKWNLDKSTFDGNYEIRILDVNALEASTIQNTLPGQILLSMTEKQSNQSSTSQTLNMTYSTQLNTLSTLKFETTVYSLNKKIEEINSAKNFFEGKTNLSNISRRNIQTNSDNQGLLANILWLKKFKKEKRTFSINGNVKSSFINASGFLYTQNLHYNFLNAIDSILNTNQNKIAIQHSKKLGIKAIYSEPLNSYSFLAVNYNGNVDYKRSELLSYDSISNYKSVDTLFSNQYRLNQFSNGGGIAYIHVKSKLRFQAGGDVEINLFNQNNVFYKSELNRKFLNWYPRVEFGYNFSQFKTLRSTYTGRTVQPTLQQIQPVINNSDPLNIYIGNPMLVPQFVNTIGINFMDFKIKGQKMLTADGSFSLIKNPISNSIFVDSSGRSKISYVNLKERSRSNFNTNFSYGQQQTSFFNLNIGLTASISGYQYSNISNGQINLVKARSYGTNVILSKLKQNRYTFSLVIGTSYYINKTSLRADINNNFLEYRVNPSFDLFFQHNFQFHNEANYWWQAKTDVFTRSLSRLIWDMWIGKKVLIKKNLLIKISANDILNQNIGFVRNSFENTIYQNTYNTVARYFRLSIVYDFNRSINLSKR